MSNEFDAEAFWEAYEEQKQDREFFEQKIKEQEEEKSNIVSFPLNLRFEFDIKAIENQIASISVAIDDVMYELKQLRRRMGQKQ
jgi:hypothetical protein